MPDTLPRRTFLAGAAALPLATPVATAAPTDDPLAATLTRLRRRLDEAGHRTLARYQLRGPDRDAVAHVLREGHAALSIVPALRRIAPADLATPAAQALMRDVLHAVGRYALLVHDALEELHAPHNRRALAEVHQAVATLGDHTTDEEFGRTSLQLVRQTRARVRAEGAPSVLATLRRDLGQVCATAEATPVPDEDPPATCAEPLEPAVAILSIVAGAVLLGVAVVGGAFAFLMVACAAAFGGPATTLLVAVLGATIVGGVLVLGIWLISRGALQAPTLSADGLEFHTHVRPACGWLTTGVVLSGQALTIRYRGRVTVPGLGASVDATGAVETPAGGDAPAPTRALGALVARVGEWCGLVPGTIEDSLELRPREGALELAVNVPSALAAKTHGRFWLGLRSEVPLA